MLFYKTKNVYFIATCSLRRQMYFDGSCNGDFEKKCNTCTLEIKYTLHPTMQFVYQVQYHKNKPVA